MASAPDRRLELFHAISDSGSAQVRKYVTDHELLEVTRFRNVIYDEVLADLKSHGGKAEQMPALWDGARLHVGAQAVIARLEAHRDVGRE